MPITSTELIFAHNATAADSAARAALGRLSVAHLSTSACVVSSFSIPASAAASVIEADDRLSDFSASALFVGPMSAIVYGMLARMRAAEVK